ncbi:MAG: 4Fe-4S binding protein [Bacillota bacterium]|nr:4Fe-4S binding protein [Bacillota bacterium]
MKEKIRQHCPNYKKHWYDYIWIFSAGYLILGFFNILFAWLGMICFITPLIIAIAGGGKTWCNRFCGRGQLFSLLGGKFGLSRNKPIPKFLRSNWFRYGFLTFFMTMFGLMVYNTYLVFAGASSLHEIITLLWAFKVPWHWAYSADVTPWIAQYAFGFYGVLMTSTILGLITMALFRPRSWCVYCPMGTMTQGICKLKNLGNKGEHHGRTSQGSGCPVKSAGQ